MAIKITPLTDTQIKAIKPESKARKYFDGGGLFLSVRPNGSKYWQMKYKKPVSKKEGLLSFGIYPQITLQQARKLRDEARKLLAQDIDPQEFKRDQLEKRQEEEQNTFEYVAREWFGVKAKSNLKADTLKDIWRSIEIHILPSIGGRSINSLKAMDFITALRPIKERGALETVKRLCQRINEVMFYAVNVGLLDANPCVKIGVAFESPQAKNMPTITKEELPDFMRALSIANIELQTRSLIEWQLLTLTRPSEASGTKWEEIDIDQKIWTIPAERMKMKRSHTIALSKQAIKILELMRSISGDRVHIFPVMKPPYDKPMSSQTPNMAIKRMGYKDRLVAHGLRALASTILNEQGFDYDVIESALAHSDPNTVRRAYNRATYLDKRRIMLDWWGDFIDEASTGNVSLSGTRAIKIINSNK